MKVNLITLLLLAFVSVSFSQCTGKPNNNPIFTNTPVKVKSVPNGALYQTGPLTPKISVIHLYGTAYEMGFAHGQLIKDIINDVFEEYNNYIIAQIEKDLPNLPEFIRYYISEFGLDAALQLTYEATREFTPQHFFDELKGLADGSGYDYNQIVRFHMFPELTQAACSMVGSWGDAINQTGGSLYQLRALDWSTDGPFQKFPTVIVYHPTDEGHPFAIWTFSGFVGALTGMSSAPLGICEKVWIRYNGTENRFGYPWFYLLRDILQFDNNVDSALNRIINAERTCSIFVGLGDPVNKFRALEYSYDYVNVYDDKNYPLYQGHPRFNDVVYIDKHTQPSQNPCLSSLIQQHYGSLDAITMIRHIAAELATGDTHAAVYDFANNFMYISVATPSVNGSIQPAYSQPWTRLDMTQLFNLPNSQ